jgi:hypothetical protein
MTVREVHVRTHFQAILALAALILLAPLVGAQGEEAIEWDRYSEEGTVEVITTNEDGSARKTKVWLAVVDGQGYIRTGKTGWGGNVERNPDVTLRIGETELPLRVEFVTDQTERDAVKDALRAKHGFSDWILSPIRGSNPKIMRLVPREAQ